MRMLLALACLLLGGCWTGEVLFSPADARQIVAPGLYEQTDGNGVQKQVRVTHRPDGMTHIEYTGESGEAPLLFGFVPFEGSGDSFLAWSVPADLPTSTVVYGLFRHESDGSFVFLSPPCTEESGADRIVRPDASPGVEGVPSCEFRSRDRLIAAMRRFHQSREAPPESRFRFVRITNG